MERRADTYRWTLAVAAALVAVLLPMAAAPAGADPVGVAIPGRGTSGVGFKATEAFDCAGDTCWLGLRQDAGTVVVPVVAGTPGAPLPIPVPSDASFPQTMSCDVDGSCLLGLAYFEEGTGAPVGAVVRIDSGVAGPVEDLFHGSGNTFAPLASDCAGGTCVLGGWVLGTDIAGVVVVTETGIGPVQTITGTEGGWASAVGCVGAGDCVVGGATDEGGFLAEVDGGAVGAGVVDDRLFDLRGLECDAVRDCVAVGQAMDPFFVGQSGGENLGSYVATIVDGIVVDDLHVFPDVEVLNDVSCPAGLDSCLVVGGDADLVHQDLYDPISLVFDDGSAGPITVHEIPVAGTHHALQVVHCDVLSCTVLGGTLVAEDGPFVSEPFLLTGLASPAPPDVTTPSVDVTSPADGAELLVGEPVAAGYSCTDEPGGSGIDTCEGTVAGTPVAPGTPLPTGTAGTHTLEVTARDRAGNQTTATRTYTVIAGSVSTPVEGGETVVAGDPPTPDAPVQTLIEVPPGTAGTVTVEPGEVSDGGTAPEGFAYFDQQIEIHGPDATPEDPYTLTFVVDATILDGRAPADVHVFRNDQVVPDCTHPAHAQPDPCVTRRGFVPGGEGDAFIEVRTSRFSIWTLGEDVSPDPTTLRADPVLVSTVGGLLSRLQLVQVSARLTTDGAPLPGKPVTFTAGTTTLCTATTGTDGRARCTTTLTNLVPLLAGVTARFTGDGDHAPSTARAGLL